MATETVQANASGPMRSSSTTTVAEARGRRPSAAGPRAHLGGSVGGRVAGAGTIAGTPSLAGRCGAGSRAVLLVAVLASAATLAPAPAGAAIERYDMRVNGLACPFCVYGVQKKLKALPGARNVSVSLGEGRVTFEVTGESALMPQQVRKAIQDAGFSPGPTTITASGTLEVAGDQVRLRLDQGHALELRVGPELRKAVEAASGTSRMVTVAGAVTDEGDREVLSVDSVKSEGS